MSQFTISAFKPIQYFGDCHGDEVCAVTFIVFREMIKALPDGHEDIASDLELVSSVTERTTRDTAVLESVERILDWLEYACPMNWEWYDHLQVVVENSCIYR